MHISKFSNYTNILLQMYDIEKEILNYNIKVVQR